jgi:predicted Zn finger-like uncharacterized protein
MIVTCSGCATRYLVDPAKLEPAGRRVRCARCGHEWWQSLEGVPPVPPDVIRPDKIRPDRARPERGVEDGEKPGLAAAASSALSGGGQAGLADEIDAGLRPRRINLPALLDTRRRFGGLGWLVLVALILLVFNGLLLGREQLVALWPPLNRLYALAGLPTGESVKIDLEFADVQTTQVIEDGRPVLVVTGKVVNGSDRRVPVPTLHFALLDGEGQTLAAWTGRAAGEAVGPQSSVAFHTRLENPPEAGRQMEATFGPARPGEN